MHYFSTKSLRLFCICKYKKFNLPDLIFNMSFIWIISSLQKIIASRCSACALSFLQPDYYVTKRFNQLMLSSETYILCAFVMFKNLFVKCASLKVVLLPQSWVTENIILSNFVQKCNLF